MKPKKIPHILYISGGNDFRDDPDAEIEDLSFFSKDILIVWARSLNCSCDYDKEDSIFLEAKSDETSEDFEAISSVLDTFLDCFLTLIISSSHSLLLPYSYSQH